MVDFFTGVKKTALKEAELLAEIIIPLPPGRTVTAYRRVARTVVDIALVNAAAAMTVNGEGLVTKIGIALGAVAPTIPRAPEAEELLVGARIDKLDRRLVESVAEKATEVAEPITDVRASAAFRKHMAKIMTRRALEDCVLSLGGTIS